MCSAISKSSPSNCHPKSQEVRYKWAVLDIGRNSVSPWTTARTITCNKGITSRFPKSRVPCQVRWHNASKPLRYREQHPETTNRVAQAPDVLRHARNRRQRAQRPHRDLRGENLRVTAVVPAQMVGRTPWSARGPPDPPPANEIGAIRIAQADGGVGCLRHAG